MSLKLYHNKYINKAVQIIANTLQALFYLFFLLSDVEFSVLWRQKWLFKKIHFNVYQKKLERGRMGGAK